MDDADRADRIIAAGYSQAVQTARAALNSGRLESATECEDCGDPIPEARRKAIPGCTKCVQCQMIAEQRS